ncbi:MAG TPA: hypothetical protein VF799_01855, partial [Geobacteraceae bacterium]
MSILKVSEEPVRNFPPSNGNLSRFSILRAIARNSGVFHHNELLHEGRTVRFRKAPPHLFWQTKEFPDGYYANLDLDPEFRAVIRLR